MRVLNFACFLDQTTYFRGGITTQLLIWLVKSHGAMVKNTISRCIEQMLTLSGIEITTFQPHSTTRASSARPAKASQFLPVDII